MGVADTPPDRRVSLIAGRTSAPDRQPGERPRSGASPMAHQTERPAHDVEQDHHDRSGRRDSGSSLCGHDALHPGPRRAQSDLGRAGHGGTCRPGPRRPGWIGRDDLLRHQRLPDHKPDDRRDIRHRRVELPGFLSAPGVPPRAGSSRLHSGHDTGHNHTGRGNFSAKRRGVDSIYGKLLGIVRRIPESFPLSDPVVSFDRRALLYIFPADGDHFHSEFAMDDAADRGRRDRGAGMALLFAARLRKRHRSAVGTLRAGATARLAGWDAYLCRHRYAVRQHPDRFLPRPRFCLWPRALAGRVAWLSGARRQHRPAAAVPPDQGRGVPQYAPLHGSEYSPSPSSSPMWCSIREVCWANS